MTTRVLVAVADGTEETEAVTVIDILRRAEFTVDVVSCAPAGRLDITASRGVKLIADKSIDAVTEQQYDLIVLPGGAKGAEALAHSETLVGLIRQQQQQQRLLAAICAAPAVVLQDHDLLDHALVTCHPDFADRIPEQNDQTDEQVVWDEHHRLITSQGPGTAMLFALALVEALAGEEKTQQIAGPLIYPYE